MSKSIEPTPAAVRDAIARGDVAGAAKALTGIVAGDRRADWAFINLIALLANHGRRADALVVARRAVVANPDNATAHEQLGTLLSVENDLPAGEWHFRRALETGGTNAGPLANLALNLMQQGRTTESEAAFAEADRLAPSTLRILAHWSKLREVQGDFAGAERLLDAAEAASSAEAINLLRVQYLARTGRDTEALGIIAAARNINGEVILYADVRTQSIEKFLAISAYRRERQTAYNTEHGITPRSVTRAVEESLSSRDALAKTANALKDAAGDFDVTETLRELEQEMLQAAENLEFEKAALLRDQIRELKRTLGEAVPGGAKPARSVSYGKGRRRR